MSVLLDPRAFLFDTSVKQFFHDRRVDLLPAAGPKFFPADPEILVYEYKCEENMVMLVKAIVPYALARINVLLDNERAQFIPSSVGNGSFVFTPYINNGALGLMDYQYNPNNTAATAANEPSVGGKGWTTISQEPKQDAERAWFNPMTTWALVTPGQKFSVTFRLLPAGGGAGAVAMGGNFEIGAAPGSDAQRVDMAGCVVTGMQMSQQAYNEMVAGLHRRTAQKAEKFQMLKDLWVLAKKKWST